MKQLANAKFDYDEVNDIITICKIQARDCKYVHEGRYGVEYISDITEKPCNIKIYDASKLFGIPAEFLISFSQHYLT